MMSAPAGAGKTTLAQKLVATFPNVVQVPSVTTRPMRDGERAGVDYHFVTEEEFSLRKNRGEFLESVELHGFRYGTSKNEIEECRARGTHVVLVIDTRGARALQKQSDPVLIFVKPPSFDVLRDRLVGRGSEDETTVQRRLEWAARELAEESYFVYTIVNDQIDEAFDVLASIIVAECHKKG